MSDEHVIEFQMPDELVSRATRLIVNDRRFVRQHGLFYAGPLAALAVLLIPPLALLWTKVSGGTFVAILLLIGLGFWGLLWLQMYRHVAWGLRLYALADPRRQIKMTFTERDILTSASGVTGSHNWEDIAEIEPLGDFWVFRLKP